MKRLLHLLALALLPGCAGAAASWFADANLQTRVGFDTNPVAVGGSAAATLRGDDALTAGATFGFSLAPPSTGKNSLKLTYTGELMRFDGWSDENYASHRFGLIGQASADAWRTSVDLSSLLVDGSRDTLTALASCNANGTTLWRERRAQWQHRARVFAQRDAGALRLRLFGTLLDYDYRTRVVAGRTAFADRGDTLVGGDLGWTQSPQSLWFAGLRAGAQHQDQVPLPGGNIDYSNRYARAVGGWEGKLGTDTTLAFAAGPDFRRYDGTIDPKLFRGRNRTLVWFEGSFATKLAPRLALTGKTTRWTWLSSTGKSAYTDLAAELSLAWNATDATTLRATTKAHQCTYFPTVRNDWEIFKTVGASWKSSARLQLFAELTHHHGWNQIPGVPDRGFTRTVLSVGTSLKL